MQNQLSPAVFGELIRAFSLKGVYVRHFAVCGGNINDTYVLETALPDGRIRSYVVQRINRSVFASPEDVAENAYAVTAHIEEKLVSQGVTDLHRRVLHYYRKSDGTFFHTLPEGCFRALSYVYDSFGTDQPDPRLLRGTGQAFGRFQALLADFPAEKLHVTIPDFHNTPKRFADLAASARADVCGRLADVRGIYDKLLSMAGQIDLYDRLHAQGKLPVRVVHNDTKCSNVMFDATTFEPLAVIDLDTVMPGLSINDFGDSIRFGANHCEEDEHDMSKVQFDLPLYEIYTRGFLEGTGGSLTETELEYLPWGARLMTLECGIRFLTDYLEGDVYFKISRPDQNLDRCRTQFKLVKDMEENWDAMNETVKRLSREIK